MARGFFLFVICHWALGIGHGGWERKLPTLPTLFYAPTRFYLRGCSTYIVLDRQTLCRRGIIFLGYNYIFGTDKLQHELSW